MNKSLTIGNYHVLLIILFFSFGKLLHGQEYIYEEHKTITVEAITQDFDLLIESLKTVHPNLYNYIPADSLNAVIDSMRGELKHALTEDQFHVEVRKLISKIGCGHTTAKPSVSWYQYQKNESKILPITVYIVDQRIYLSQSFSEDTLLKRGNEILAINQHPAKDIIKEMRAIQQRDGYSQSYVNYNMQALFNTFYLFIYGRSDQYNIDYIDEFGQPASTSIRAGYAFAPKAATSVTDNSIELKMSGAKFSLPKDNSSYAVIDIDYFATKGFKKFYKSVFKTIDKNNINYLVIDVRDNGGGYFLNGNRLLSYLLKEPFQMHFWRPRTKVTDNEYLKMHKSNVLTEKLFKAIPDRDANDPNRNFKLKYKPAKKNHFSGQVFILTNGGSFSLSSYVASQLNAKLDVVCIGTETGGGDEGSNAILNYTLTLPNSHIRVIIPYYHFDHDITCDPRGRGVIPDIHTPYSLEDLLNNMDLEMQALDKVLIHKQATSE